MRESLTVLAGLMLLALLAALIGPGLVDWRAYRPQIEARLGAALGVEARVAGGIELRLLPSPRLTLGEVRIGEPAGAASAVAAEQVTVELAIGALARGEFRVSDAQAEGATLTLVADDAGRVLLPQRAGAGLPAQTSLDRFSLRRSAVVWREPGQAPVTLSPVALEIAAVSLAGPWRIEGEVAGTSLRLATGAMEPDGKLRAKASVTGEEGQLGFDGTILLPVSDGQVRPSLEGAFTAAPGGALSLSGRVAGDSRKLDLAALVIDVAGGAARLEGEGQFLPVAGTGSLSLRARRLDADALTAALAERPGFSRALRALPGKLDLGLDLDQLVWRGEDFSALALRGALTEDGLRDASASLRVGGALIGATGAADAGGVRGRLNLKAPDARRLALVLLRAGLDPALADLVGGLGQIDAEAIGAWREERLSLERLMVAGASGVRLEGSGALAPDRLDAKVTLNGLDLNTLPPGASLTGLIGDRELALDLALTAARFRNAPPGSAILDLRRQGASWRLARLAIDGFGGVAVTGAGALLPEGGEIAGRIRAPRFETLAALAGPLLPETARLALARVGEGLSRLDAGYRLTRAPSGETAVLAEGAAQAGRLVLDGRLDAGGVWTAADLRFDLADRRQAFAALGLPAPALGGPGRLLLGRNARGMTGSLAGPGLSVVLDGEPDSGPRLTVQAEAPGQILPEGPARLLPDGVLDLSGRVRFEPDATAIDGLVAHLGGVGATGALNLRREGAVSGRLALQRADLRRLMAASLGASQPVSGGVWSTVRFAPAAGLGELALRIEAGSLTAFDDMELRDASFDLRTDATGLQLESLTGSYAGGRVSGRLSARRDGGLAQLSGRVGLEGVEFAGLTNGALSGRFSGQIEAGGSGESPARLMAGLSGAGTVSLSGASLARFDPSAYGRIIAATGEDASESETPRLQRRLGEALDRAAWPLGEVTLPFTLAGGIIRLQPQALSRAELQAEASGLIDLRALTADLRLALRPLGPLPKGWPGTAPQLGVAWRGPLSDLRRETDVGALANTVAARALAREIERVEAFEADARERAMHARRLRAEREMRENERRLALFLKAEEERRLAEEARRAAEEARRLAEEKRALEAQRIEEARRAEEAKRRAEAEERVRLVAEERARAAAARAAAQQQPQPAPLILPGAPRQSVPDELLPPLAPPQNIAPVPSPFSRGLPAN